MMKKHFTNIIRRCNINKQCGYGGTGRRADFRCQWGDSCRFEFCYPHHIKLLEMGAFLFLLWKLRSDMMRKDKTLLCMMGICLVLFVSGTFFDEPVEWFMAEHGLDVISVVAAAIGPLPPYVLLAVCFSYL